MPISKPYSPIDDPRYEGNHPKMPTEEDRERLFLEKYGTLPFYACLPEDTYDPRFPED